MRIRFAARITRIARLLDVAACDSACIPGAHHQDVSVTGSRLPGVDTGA